MELKSENYYSQEANKEYLSCSQIKDFIRCESYALAKINGEWEDEPSKAMALSSYIDAIISDEETEFLNSESEKVKNGETSFIVLKSGKLSADAQAMAEIVKQAENDEMFIKYLKGEHQVIMTGNFDGIPIKAKLDSYFPNKVIVDLKAMKDFDLIWDEKDRTRKNFVDMYDYILQAALYQEMVRQNTGKQLPFIIAAMTKEKISERALLNIPQEKMDERLEEIKPYLTRIQDIKLGKIEPQSCGKCDYCKSLAKVHNIYNYNEYFEKRGGN